MVRERRKTATLMLHLLANCTQGAVRFISRSPSPSTKFTRIAGARLRIHGSKRVHFTAARRHVSIVKEKLPRKTYCSLCSRLRRGILYPASPGKLVGVKIALDTIATHVPSDLLLNLLSRALASHFAELVADGGDTSSPPALLLPKKDNSRFADLAFFPICLSTLRIAGPASRKVWDVYRRSRARRPGTKSIGWPRCRTFRPEALLVGLGERSACRPARDDEIPEGRRSSTHCGCFRDRRAEVRPYANACTKRTPQPPPLGISSGPETQRYVTLSRSLVQHAPQSSTRGKTSLGPGKDASGSPAGRLSTRRGHLPRGEGQLDH